VAFNSNSPGVKSLDAGVKKWMENDAQIPCNKGQINSEEQYVKA